MITSVVFLVQSYRLYADLRLKKKVVSYFSNGFESQNKLRKATALQHVFIYWVVKKGIWKILVNNT